MVGHGFVASDQMVVVVHDCKTEACAEPASWPITINSPHVTAK